jgi:hypothetical protein
MTSPVRRLLFPVTLLLLSISARPLCADEAPADKVFAAVHFDRWAGEGDHQDIPWKIEIRPYGLSLHQRLRAYIGIALKRRELAKIPPQDRLLLLIQIVDSHGRHFRDYVMFHMKEWAPEIQKGELDIVWDMYMLPGDYQTTVMLVNAENGKHDVRSSALRVEPLKNDPLPNAWADLPPVEFLDPMLRGPDAMFRSDISSKLHLPLAARRPVHLEVLVDVTASDLFHGSTTFYNRYLGVALPLLKALSQIQLERGSIDVAMLDLRKRAVTFEQDSVRQLEWKKAKEVLAPEKGNGPGTIDVRALEQRRESPAFLQDELLRRLGNAPAGKDATETPLHVFVIIGSPMDFYSFRDLPHLPAGSEENCVVYYLQFELLNTTYADGAVGNVRRMLKPLPVRVFKVRSAESIRHALAKMLEEVAAL